MLGRPAFNRRPPPEWAATWTGGRGRIRCAADAAGHHCEDRFRRARQSRRHAGSEEAVSSTRCCSSGSSHRERATVVDVDPGVDVRFADLFIEGTAGRFMVKQTALGLS